MIRWIALVSCLVSSTIARADDDPLYLCKASPANAQLSVTFKPETELKDLITWTMGFQCRNVVVAADVVKHAPKVTLIAPKKLTPKQALDLFVDAVESIGLVATVKADTIVIKPGPTGWRGCSDVAQVNTLPNPYESDENEKLWATIKKIDDTHFEVPRAVADKVFADPNLPKGARVVPAMKDGKPEGLKLYAIRPSSLLAHVGLTNGDTLVSVNGLPLLSADHGLEVYKKLKTEKRFEVQLVRRGKPLTLVITVK
jgi:hypothetical protein